MAAFNKYENFSEDLSEGVHNLNADVLKVMLSNTAPDGATHTIRSQATEISAGFGYAAGGTDTQNSTSRAGGVTSVLGVDFTFTASGGPIGPFRYAILYNDTPTSPVDPLIGWWDYASSITLADGETLDVDFGASLLTVT